MAGVLLDPHSWSVPIGSVSGAGGREQLYKPEVAKEAFANFVEPASGSLLREETSQDREQKRKAKQETLTWYKLL